MREGDRVDAAFYPQINEYHGHRSVQLLMSALREEVRAVPGLRQPAVEYVPAERQGVGQAERAHEQLHGAVTVVFVLSLIHI